MVLLSYNLAGVLRALETGSAHLGVLRGMRRLAGRSRLAQVGCNFMAIKENAPRVGAIHNTRYSRLKSRYLKLTLQYQKSQHHQDPNPSPDHPNQLSPPMRLNKEPITPSLPQTSIRLPPSNPHSPCKAKKEAKPKPKLKSKKTILQRTATPPPSPTNQLRERPPPLPRKLRKRSLLDNPA